MLRLLAAGWLTNRLARPIGRLIPNPILRAAAMAGLGVVATRFLQKRSEPETPDYRPPRS